MVTSRDWDETQVEKEWMSYTLVLALEQSEVSSGDENFKVDWFLWSLEAWNQKDLCEPNSTQGILWKSEALKVEVLQTFLRTAQTTALVLQTENLDVGCTDLYPNNNWENL